MTSASRFRCQVERIGLISVLLAGCTGLSGAALRTERMAAWHRTMVCISENSPQTDISTYTNTGSQPINRNSLVKIAPLSETSGEGLLAAVVRDLVVRDLPGAVEAEFTMAEARVNVRVTPLFVGREAGEWEGAVCYRVTAVPAMPIVLGFGDGGAAAWGPSPQLARHDLLPLRDLSLEADLARFSAGPESLRVAVSGSGVFVRGGQGESAELLSMRFDHGEGTILLAYAETASRAGDLARASVDRAQATVTTYYDHLLENRLQTPEASLDDAFRSALLTLEYNWLEPYGWNECIHHWLAMWHNQQTAGAEWIGQQERARVCTEYLGNHLLSSGAIPQYYANGMSRRDFGGSNQFWAWQVRHHWRFTGDKGFAQRMAPVLDRVLEQTLEEHDPDGNLLIGWGLQIGNQEDFIQFYHDGATPSIELINMMETRADLALAGGQSELAEVWRQRCDRSRSALRQRLWQHDLGRLASYVDQEGSVRLDGQYHTFLYPVIWGLVDDIDAYTSLRHVQDRLTGDAGETYCSNNFPNHHPGTWGMQAGVAQQPWAAWAYAAAGRPAWTWRPLKVAADWVMDENHRGSWPEVSTEPTPAYFSPPAGLFIAAAVEALFGLGVDRPAGVLHVRPSFPPHWPEASVQVAGFNARYATDDGSLHYTVTSTEPLRRVLAWSLPPSRVRSVLLDGRPCPFTVEPGVDRVVVHVETEATTRSRFTVSAVPLGCSLSRPRSVAEGEAFDVGLVGPGRLLGVVDRGGVLADVAQTGTRTLSLRLRRGLLDPYLAYGRLGQMTFSRRTFMVRCEADGRRFLLPVDLAVLPRCEAAAASGVQVTDEGFVIPVTVRNNTAAQRDGTAVLQVARHELSSRISIAARSESIVHFSLPFSAASLLAPGDSSATLSLPGEFPLVLRVDSSGVWVGVEALGRVAEARLQPVSLPPEDMSPYQEWTGLRLGSHGGAVPWPGWTQPLHGMETTDTVAVPDIPGLVFRTTPGQWVLVGRQTGRGHYRLHLPHGVYRGLYLLTAWFVDNHDMYTHVATVTVNGLRQPVLSRRIHLPGDVDWWECNGMGKTMDSTRFGRPDRLGLLPLLGAVDGDWGLAHPPAFPQPEFWSTNRVVRTPNCIFTVLELELPAPTEATSVDISMNGICPGMALAAVVADRGGCSEALEGTPYALEPRFREPEVLFVLDGRQPLEGWQTTGFALTKPFDTTSLNSLLPAGESATGLALSPLFQIKEGQRWLELVFHGGRSVETAAGESLCIQLVDADSGAIFGTLLPPGTHVLSTGRLDLDGLTGKRLRLRLVDQNTASSYAWIGVREVRIRY